MRPKTFIAVLCVLFGLTIAYSKRHELFEAWEAYDPLKEVKVQEGE